MTRFHPDTDPPRTLTRPDEGRDVEVGTIDALRTVLERDVDSAGKQWVRAKVLEAEASQLSIKPSGRASLRRFEASRALVACASRWPDDPDTPLRAALAHVIGELDPAWPTGAVLGSCTWDEAARVAHALDALHGGALILVPELPALIPAWNDAA